MRRSSIAAAVDASLLVARRGSGCCCFKSHTKSITISSRISVSLYLSHHHHLSLNRARLYGTRATTPAQHAPKISRDEHEQYESEEDGESEYEEDFSSDDLVDEEELDDDSDDSDDFYDKGEEEDEEREVVAGDGEDGGGIVLGGTDWGAKALEIAKTMLSVGGDLALYGFKVNASGFIHVRLDKLTDKFGSPTMQEVEKFNLEYLARLEQAGRAGLVPANVSIEVSSPGAERVLQIPADFNRFKEQPMQVFYYAENGTSATQQHILELESFEQASLTSVWKLANVRANREVQGKGRSLNKKQREWRLELPVTSIKMVRLHVDGIH